MWLDVLWQSVHMSAVPFLPARMLAARDRGAPPVVSPVGASSWHMQPSGMV